MYLNFFDGIGNKEHVSSQFLGNVHDLPGSAKGLDALGVGIVSELKRFLDGAGKVPMEGIDK